MSLASDDAPFRSDTTPSISCVNVGTRQLGKQNLSEGYNKFKFTGLTPSKVQLEVWDGSTMVGGGYGRLEVRDLNPSRLQSY